MIVVGILTCSPHEWHKGLIFWGQTLQPVQTCCSFRKGHSGFLPQPTNLHIANLFLKKSPNFHLFYQYILNQLHQSVDFFKIIRTTHNHKTWSAAQLDATHAVSKEMFFRLLPLTDYQGKSRAFQKNNISEDRAWNNCLQDRVHFNVVLYGYTSYIYSKET